MVCRSTAVKTRLLLMMMVMMAGENMNSKIKSKNKRKCVLFPLSSLPPLLLSSRRASKHEHKNNKKPKPTKILCVAPLQAHRVRETQITLLLLNSALHTTCAGIDLFTGSQVAKTKENASALMPKFRQNKTHQNVAAAHTLWPRTAIPIKTTCQV
jgi:hypothetical protein